MMEAPALFLGIHRAGLADGRIGFPELFYRTVYPERTVVLTVKNNHLIGYRTAIWRLLRQSLETLYVSPEEQPPAVAGLLEHATECRIMTLSESAASCGDPLPDRFGHSRVVEVPPAMILAAELTFMVVLPGLGHHFEIWSQRNWQRVKNRVPYSTLKGPSNPPDIPA